MTITVLPSRNELTANAGQTIFNYTFKIFSITDLNVYITPAGQDANDSTDLTTAYTVLGVSDEDGGTITLTAGANLNDLVTIVSNTPSLRTTDYQNNGDFRPEVVNSDFDRVVSLVKKIEDTVNRTVVLPQSQQGPKPLSLPNPEAGKIMNWKGDLSGLQNIEVAEISPAAVPANTIVKAEPDLATALADTSLLIGMALNLKDRITGNGGGAMWDVFTAGTFTVSAAIFDVFDHDTLPLQLKLRVDGVVSAKEFGATGDGVTNDGAALVAADTFALGLGGVDIILDPGTYIISSLFTMSVGNGLIGQDTDNTVIKQINTSAGGVKMSTFCRFIRVRVEAPIASGNTATRGLDVSETQNITVDHVRILFFGDCFYGEGLLWRHTISYLRIDNPSNRGFVMDGLGQGIQSDIYMNTVYVRNDSQIGANTKFSYLINDSLSTTMVNVLQDGGIDPGGNDLLDRSNVGMLITLSNVVMNNVRFERNLPAIGGVAGSEYDGILSISGSTVTINGLQFHNCKPNVVADQCWVYAENSSQVVLNGLTGNSFSLSQFSTQQVGISDDFGDNIIELDGGLRDIILGPQRGTGVGEAQYTREGKITKETIVGASTVIDVNAVKTILLFGTTGDVSGFSGAHSDGQKVRLLARQAGATLTDSATFKLQAGGNFPVVVNGSHIFEYFNEGGFWSEMSRNP